MKVGELRAFLANIGDDVEMEFVLEDEYHNVMDYIDREPNLFRMPMVVESLSVNSDGNTPGTVIGVTLVYKENGEDD